VKGSVILTNLYADFGSHCNAKIGIEHCSSLYWPWQWARVQASRQRSHLGSALKKSLVQVCCSFVVVNAMQHISYFLVLYSTMCYSTLHTLFSSKFSLFVGFIRREYLLFLSGTIVIALVVDLYYQRRERISAGRVSISSLNRVECHVAVVSPLSLL